VAPPRVEAAPAAPEPPTDNAPVDDDGDDREDHSDEDRDHSGEDRDHCGGDCGEGGEGGGDCAECGEGGGEDSDDKWGCNGGDDADEAVRARVRSGPHRPGASSPGPEPVGDGRSPGISPVDWFTVWPLEVSADDTVPSAPVSDKPAGETPPARAPGIGTGDEADRAE
jgi:hypothetical protein